MSGAQTNFPPGKKLPADAWLIRSYANRISEGWHHAAEDMIGVARLCLEASEQLTVSEKKELIRQLPFKEAAFSKFVRIGKDAWVHALHARRLLPPHYTIVYLLTRLTDEELESAIREGVINPDMKRADLQSWLKARQLRTQNPHADHSAAILDHCGAEVLAAKDQGALAALRAAWAGARDLQIAWTNATASERERFVREVLQVNLSRPASGVAEVAAVPSAMQTMRTRRIADQIREWLT